MSTDNFQVILGSERDRECFDLRLDRNDFFAHDSRRRKNCKKPQSRSESRALDYVLWTQDFS